MSLSVVSSVITVAGITRNLKIGPPAVSRAIRKGEKIVEGDQELKEWMMKLLKQ